MKTITPCLWFDTEALDAAKYYVSVFPDSSLGDIGYYDESNPHGTPWKVMIVGFTIMGQEFMGLNGGPIFSQSEAVSFMIPVETQQEIDYYYDKLSAVPESEQCGWVKDTFGVSWQIIPNRFTELMKNGDKEKISRLMKYVLSAKRLNIAEIEKAYNG